MIPPSPVRRLAAAAVLAALSASVLAPIAQAAPATRPASAPAEGTPSDPESAASLRAVDTGKRVRVEADTTETQAVYAEPSGTFTLEQHLGAPVRVKRDGEWTPVDTTLRQAADGTWRPVATDAPTRFSAGGEGPAMILAGSAHQSVAYTWPGKLPAPSVDGASATYGDVLPGVDLRLTATATGAVQDLVIHDRKAAADPELTALKWSVKTEGVDLGADAAGNVAATAEGSPASAAPALSAPTPLLADASGKPSGPAAVATPKNAPPTAGDAADGARTAVADATVSASGTTMTLAPDTTFLAAATTAFPVVLSQPWSQGNKLAWTRVYSSYPTTAYWNSSDVARVGHEDDTGGTSRSLFRVDTSPLKGAHIVSSTFRTYENWSWSCSARSVELWATNTISSATTWKNQPSWVSKLGAQNVAKGWGRGCPAGGVEFSVTAKAQESADKGWDDVTLGLRAASETDTYAWKKFDNDPVLATEYDRAPGTPTSYGSDPALACGQQAPFPYLGATIAQKGISLHATVADPDGGNVTGQFVFSHYGGEQISAPENKVASGSVAKVTIPSANLADGTYSWHVRARDDYGMTSAYTPVCHFTVDATPPNAQPAVSSDQYPENVTGAAARTPGTFTVTAGGISDVTAFQYSLNKDFTTGSTPRSVRTDKAGGTADIKLTPTQWGSNVLYVRSADAAGNLSTTYKYVFKTAPSHADPEGDFNGDGHADVVTVDSTGTLIGHMGTGAGTFAAPEKHGGGWSNSRLSHRGDWTGDGYEDLIAHLGSNPQNLWIYPGNGLGNWDARIALDRPTGSPSADWSKTTRIITVGDVTWDTYPDILAVEDDAFYLFPGTATGQLDSPTKIADSGWGKLDLIAPGDVDGDGLDDLWVRDTDSGALTQILNDTGDPGNSLADLDRGQQIGAGYTAAAHPGLDSQGDLTGDNHPDLWAPSASASPVVISGTADADKGTVFPAA